MTAPELVQTGSAPASRRERLEYADYAKATAIFPVALLPAAVIAGTAFVISILRMIVFLNFTPWIFGKTSGRESQASQKETVMHVFVMRDYAQNDK